MTFKCLRWLTEKLDDGFRIADGFGVTLIHISLSLTRNKVMITIRSESSGMSSLNMIRSLDVKSGLSGRDRPSGTGETFWFRRGYVS
jgi:hypothetical protein